jgi:sigma-B regulation protein RsbU (phosphoserine phosphatase)
MRVRADRRRRPAVRVHGPRCDSERRCAEWTARTTGRAALSPVGSEAGMTDATAPGARILVVDDNDDNRYTLTLYLELEGYADIQIAEDGEQAIARLDKEEFDVVLLDVMMPRVDGYQVLSWLKDQRRLQDLPVIMISALNEMTSVVRCIELGAVDYLLKPFNQVLLKARLGASLERKRLHDQVNAHLLRLEQELEAARDLQMSMLPQVFPPPVRQCPVDVWGLVHPAREVGGDLYDVFTTGDGSLCFFVGDVSGKGMPAALFMARTKSLIRITTELMREREGAAAAPADIIGRVNRELCQNNNDMMFVTLFFGMLSLETGEVLYCNAGHNPPYRVNSDKPQAIEDAHGITLGIQPQATYQTGRLILAPGETLYLYSDGVTEAHDPGGDLFCEHRLEAVLGTHAGRGSREVVGGVTEALKGFVGTAPPHDDITMLALRWLDAAAL